MKQKTKEEQSIDILKRLAKRIEQATVDTHDIKFDLKAVKLRLGKVEDNTDIMKVDIENTRGDIEKIKKDIKDIKRNTDDLMETTAEILKNAATRGEIDGLSQRVTALEQS